MLRYCCQVEFTNRNSSFSLGNSRWRRRHLWMAATYIFDLVGWYRASSISHWTSFWKSSLLPGPNPVKPLMEARWISHSLLFQRYLSYPIGSTSSCWLIHDTIGAGTSPFPRGGKPRNKYVFKRTAKPRIFFSFRHCGKIYFSSWVKVKCSKSSSLLKCCGMWGYCICCSFQTSENDENRKF